MQFYLHWQQVTTDSVAITEAYYQHMSNEKIDEYKHKRTLIIQSSVIQHSVLLNVTLENKALIASFFKQ